MGGKMKVRHHVNQSWMMNALAIGCFVACAALINENIRREAWPWHYWVQPFLAFAVGLAVSQTKHHRH
jgi:hypothetical protein